MLPALLIFFLSRIFTTLARQKEVEKVFENCTLASGYDDWFVPIYNLKNEKFKSICEGALIAPYFVLTSFSCLSEKGKNTIVVKPKGGELHAVKNIISNELMDISILVLEEEALGSPVCILKKIIPIDEKQQILSRQLGSETNPLKVVQDVEPIIESVANAVGLPNCDISSVVHPKDFVCLNWAGGQNSSASGKNAFVFDNETHSLTAIVVHKHESYFVSSESNEYTAGLAHYFHQTFYWIKAVIKKESKEVNQLGGIEVTGSSEKDFCPISANFKQVNGKCFYLSPVKKDVRTAKRVCKARYGILFEPKSKEESSIFKNGDELEGKIWIGVGQVDGKLLYLSRYEEIPNGIMNIDKPDESHQCVLLKKDGTWSKGDCNEENYFVCDMTENSGLCPLKDGYEILMNKCMYYERKLHTYDESLGKCQQLGGTLIEPKSKALINALPGITLDDGPNYFRSVYQDTTTHFWIGVNDKTEEGHFVYQSSNEKVSLTHSWSRNLKNSKPNDDCVAMGKVTPDWKEERCYNTLSSICELHTGLNETQGACSKCYIKKGVLQCSDYSMEKFPMELNCINLQNHLVFSIILKNQYLETFHMNSLELYPNVIDVSFENCDLRNLTYDISGQVYKTVEYYGFKNNKLESIPKGFFDHTVKVHTIDVTSNSEEVIYESESASFCQKLNKGSIKYIGNLVIYTDEMKPLDEEYCSELKKTKKCKEDGDIFDCSDLSLIEKQDLPCDKNMLIKSGTSEAQIITDFPIEDIKRSNISIEGCSANTVRMFGGEKVDGWKRKYSIYVKEFDLSQLKDKLKNLNVSSVLVMADRVTMSEPIEIDFALNIRARIVEITHKIKMKFKLANFFTEPAGSYMTSKVITFKDKHQFRVRHYGLLNIVDSVPEDYKQPKCKAKPYLSTEVTSVEDWFDERFVNLLRVCIKSSGEMTQEMDQIEKIYVSLIHEPVHLIQDYESRFVQAMNPIQFRNRDDIHNVPLFSLKTVKGMAELMHERFKSFNQKQKEIDQNLKSNSNDLLQLRIILEFAYANAQKLLKGQSASLEGITTASSSEINATCQGFRNNQWSDKHQMELTYKSFENLANMMLKSESNSNDLKNWFSLYKQEAKADVKRLGEVISRLEDQLSYSSGRAKNTLDSLKTQGKNFTKIMDKIVMDDAEKCHYCGLAHLVIHMERMKKKMGSALNLPECYDRVILLSKLPALISGSVPSDFEFDYNQAMELLSARPTFTHHEHHLALLHGCGCFKLPNQTTFILVPKLKQTKIFHTYSSLQSSKP